MHLPQVALQLDHVDHCISHGLVLQFSLLFDGPSQSLGRIPCWIKERKIVERKKLKATFCHKGQVLILGQYKNFIRPWPSPPGTFHILIFIIFFFSLTLPISLSDFYLKALW